MIINAAKADAKRIVREAEVIARELIETAQENAKSNLAGWTARQKQMAERSGDRIIGKARNEAHMRIMSAKAKIIDAAFQEAQKQFGKERSTARYKAFLKNLITNAGIQIGGGGLIVLARKEDQDVISKITGLGTAISKATNQSTKVIVGKKAHEMIGGVMVQNKEGNITVDYRVDTLLSQVEVKYRNEIAKSLFPKEKTSEKPST